MGDSILFPPTLSSSSMKMTQGALAFASSANHKSNRLQFGLITDVYNTAFCKLTEKISDAARSDAHEHLVKLRPGGVVERHVGLAGHSARQKSFSGSRRPNQEDPWKDSQIPLC